MCIFPSSHVSLSQPSPQVDRSGLVPTSTAASDEDRLLQILQLYTRRPGSTFTSNNQRLLLHSILTGKRQSIIAVLPTGSGKSIAIFGPILAETEGVSVVITCYAALRRQLAEQARSFGIKHLVWSDR